MPASVRFFNPPMIATPVGYSHVAEVTDGRMIFISGQIALDSAGNLVGKGDMRAQTQQVFENIKAALEAVGASFAQVVKLTYYLTDISQMQVVREVRNQYLNLNAPPASTAVEVRQLVRKEFLIEVEAVAVI
jgi:reactive intermediate/imine deaminase